MLKSRVIWKNRKKYLADSKKFCNFATGYKMIVVYPAGRPFRLWLNKPQAFFLPIYINLLASAKRCTDMAAA